MNHLPKIVADQLYSFMAPVDPDGSDLFQQDNARCHTAKKFQEGFEQHVKSS